MSECVINFAMKTIKKFNRKFGECVVKEISWGSFEPKFITELVTWINGRRVLEVFAGNGLLAKLLSEQGVSIKATSLFRSHDGHERGLHFPVEELDAVAAIKKYRDDADLLLMSWPVAEESASRGILEWSASKPVIYIGEVTNIERNQLGGCATDSFFEITKSIASFSKYKSNRSGIDRAEIREVHPNAPAIFESLRRSGKIYDEPDWETMFRR